MAPPKPVVGIYTLNTYYFWRESAACAEPAKPVQRGPGIPPNLAGL